MAIARFVAAARSKSAPTVDPVPLMRPGRMWMRACSGRRADEEGKRRTANQKSSVADTFNVRGVPCVR